jgi:hypothetical protein
MEKRSYSRIALNNLIVDACDGFGFYVGMISDVSRFGLCLTGFPLTLEGRVQKMTVIVSGEGMKFKMNIRPRWSISDNNNRTVGAQILDAPWSWTEFVMDLEPRVKDDVWRSAAGL